MSERGFVFDDDDDDPELGDRLRDAFEMNQPAASDVIVLQPVRPRWWWWLTPWRKRCDSCGGVLTKEGRVWQCPADGRWYEAPSRAPNSWWQRRQTRKWLAERHRL